MRKFYCGGCLTSFFVEDPIEPVHCPECNTWEGVQDKGEALPRKYKVTYTWIVNCYATWQAAQKAKKRGFSDYDCSSVSTVRDANDND